MTEATIELDCPACGVRLRIPAGVAPPQIRCPACGETFPGVTLADAAPGLASGAAPQAPPPAEPQWHLRTPEGLAFGPVSRDTIERWVREGRVTGDCQLRRDTDAEWSLAEASFAALRSPIPPVSSATQSPRSSPATAASHVPAPSAPSLSAQLLPHRGPLILTLALVGLLVQCPIFSVMAWVMGSADMEEMARGRMDPSGASLTRAGRTLGLILSLFWIIMAVILVAGLIFVVALQAAPL